MNRERQGDLPPPYRAHPTSDRTLYPVPAGAPVRSSARHRGPAQHRDGMSGGTALALGLGAAALGAVAAGVMVKRRSDQAMAERPSDDADARFREDGDWHGRFAVAGKSVLINRPRSEVYAYWRDLSNQSKFLENVESVAARGTRSTWTMKGLPGQTYEIEVELTDDVEDERLAFSSVEGSDIEMRGHVEFREAPAGRGTYVEFVMEYVPPAGSLGRTVANLTRRSPQVQARHALKRLKMLLEAGEVATSAHNRAEQEHGDRNADANEEAA